MNEFHFERMAYEKSSYFSDDWRRAVPISVIAKTETDARERIFAISPELESNLAKIGDYDYSYEGSLYPCLTIKALA